MAEERLEVATIIDVFGRDFGIQPAPVAEYLALSGLGEDDELMGEITADRTGVGALIEANHDDAGIIWPESVAPFGVGLINLRQGDARCRDVADDLYTKLLGAGIEVLYDDRDESPGAKFATMDLIGLPDQLVIGPRGIAAGTIELKQRQSGERQDVSTETALDRVTTRPHLGPLPGPGERERPA